MQWLEHTIFSKVTQLDNCLSQQRDKNTPEAFESSCDHAPCIQGQRQEKGIEKEEMTA